MTDTQSPDRDVSAIPIQDWSYRPAGKIAGEREYGFQVVYRQSVLDEIHLHGQGSPAIEVCGVLLGTGYRDENGPYLLIEHCVRGNGAKNKSTSVTFTAETWANIQNVMDRDYPDEKIVGWYHTHPGFGIFLSDMDVFICENFFNLPWQVAFVYDPLGGDEGNFVWHGGKPVREAVLIEDIVTPKAAEIPLIGVNETIDDEFKMQVEAKFLEMLVRVRRLETRQKKLIIALVFLTGFALMLLVQTTPVQVSPVQNPPIPTVTAPPGPTPLPANSSLQNMPSQPVLPRGRPGASGPLLSKPQSRSGPTPL